MGQTLVSPNVYEFELTTDKRYPLYPSYRVTIRAPTQDSCAIQKIELLDIFD